MAQANLGVRVVLDDAASAGFNNIGLGVGNLLGQIGNLAWAISLLPANLQGAAVAAAGFGLAFQGASSALGDVVDAAMGLQDSMARVRVNVKGADADMSQLTNTINMLADYSVFSSQQIADGFVMMGQKGFDASQIISGNMGQAMTDLAESINSGPVPAAQMLTSAMQIWGANASQATQYANILSFAFHNGVPDASALQTAIAQAGAQAVAMGIPFQDFAAVLDYFGQKGLSGGQAALSLKNILISLSDPTIKAQKEMADLGIITVNKTAPGIQALVAQVNSLNKTPIQMDGSLTSLQHLFDAAQKLNLLGTDKSFYQWASDAGFITNNLYDKSGHLKDIDTLIQQLNTDLSKLQNPQDSNTAIEQLFNRTALKGGQLLFGQDDTSQKKVQELRQAMLDYASTGGVVSDAAKITGTAHSKLKELGSTVHSAAAQIGSQFLPVIGNVAGGLNNFLNMLRTHDPALMKFIGVLLVVATVIAGIGTVVAGAVLFFGAFGEAIGAALAVAGPIVAVIAAVVGVVALLITHWKQVQEILKPIGDLFATVAGTIGSVVGPVLKTIIGQLGALFKSVWPELKSALGGMMSAFQGIGSMLAQMSPLWNILKIALIAIGAVIGGVLVAALAGLVGIISGVVHALTFIIVGLANIAKGILGFVNGALQFFVHGWQTIINVIKALLTGHFKEIPGILGKGLSQMGKALLTMVQGIGNILKGAFIGLVGGLAGAVWGMFSGVFNTFGSIIHKFTGLGGDTIKGLLTGLGHAGQAVGRFFQDLWNGLLAKIRSMLGIASPSRVFADIGMNLIKGLMNGLKGAVGALMGVVSGIVKGLVNAVLGPLKGLAGAVGHAIKGVAGAVTKPLKGLGHAVGHLFGGIFGSGHHHAKKMHHDVTHDTNQTKTEVIKHFVAMQMQSIHHMQAMAVGIENQIKHAKTAAEKHALEMKLGVLKHAIEQHMQVVQHAVAAAKGVMDAHAQMKPVVISHWLEMMVKTVAHHAEMHAQHIGHTKGMTSEHLRHIQQMKLQHILHIQQLKLQHLQHILEMKLKSLAHTGNLKEQAILHAQLMKVKMLEHTAALKTSAVGHLSDMKTNMLGALQDLPGQFGNLAKNIVDGLNNGLKNGASTITNTLSGMAQGGLQQFRKTMGIQSPSKVFHQLGSFLSQGMVLGIQSVDVAKQANAHWAAVLPDRNGFHNPNYAAMHTQHSAAQFAGMQGGDFIIPLQVDGKTIAQVTIDRLTGKMKSQGVGRKLR